MKIAFYVGHINNIGGIETWLYYIAKLYGDNHDITLYYASLAEGAEAQLERLRPYIKVRKYWGQKVNCDVVISGFATADLSNFNAKEKIGFVHAAYSTYDGYKNPKIPEDITKLAAVSNYAADDFENISGVRPEVIYNPVAIDKPRKVLKLVSATRISNDKGSIWDKMKRLARILNDNNIPFIWLVFTNNHNVICDVPNIILMPSTLSIIDYIAEADYLVQLSKSEAFAYSVVESLLVGTPVLITNYKSAPEMGVIDGKNGYIFDMDLSNVDVDKIYNHIPSGFTYHMPDSSKEWNEILGKPCKKKPENKEELVWVKCVEPFGFRDAEFGNKKRRYKEKWQTTYERAEYLADFLDPKTFTRKHLVDIISTD